MFKGKILTIDEDTFKKFKEVASVGGRQYISEIIQGTDLKLVVDHTDPTEVFVSLEEFKTKESFTPYFDSDTGEDIFVYRRFRDIKRSGDEGWTYFREEVPGARRNISSAELEEKLLTENPWLYKILMDVKELYKVL